MNNPVVHFEVIGKDPSLLQNYYSQLFGWQINQGAVPGYGTIDAGDTGISGGVGGGHIPDYDGHVTFYVEVAEVEASLAKAEELGGRRLFGPETVTEGVVLGQFVDPEGHMVGLLERQS
jgi:uncharacterized protein